MDKQNQIEEMVITAYPIYSAMGDDLRKEAIGCMNSYTVFERLYNAGYRKIFKNAVVLTREEYEKHKGFSREEVDEISETAIKNSRKRTAREIYDFAKGFFTWDEEGFVRELKELVQDYGVEVE